MTRIHNVTATCPECNEVRTIRSASMGAARAATGVVRRCRACFNQARRLPMIARVCADCGDVRHLRGRDRPGARCRGCQIATINGPTPRDDIDDVMVDRLMGGRDRGSNIAERLEATARLIGLYRLPAWLVAERVGISVRTLERYKRELRETGRLAA